MQKTEILCLLSPGDPEKNLSIFFQCLPRALSLKMRIKLKINPNYINTEISIMCTWPCIPGLIKTLSLFFQGGEIFSIGRPSLRNCNSWHHILLIIDIYIYFKNIACFISYYLITPHEQDPKQTAEFRKVYRTTLKITGCNQCSCCGRWVWGTCVVMVHSSENAVGFTATLNNTNEMHWYENGIFVSVVGERSLLTFSPSFFCSLWFLCWLIFFLPRTFDIEI